MTARDDLLQHLRAEESLRLTVYDDATGLELQPGRELIGNPTIGYGRNLLRGLTVAEAELLLGNDADSALQEAAKQFSWFSAAPAAVQVGFADMLFNLGLPRLLGFHDLLTCAAKSDWLGMSNAALDSKWAAQIGDRSTKIAELFRSASSTGATS